VPPTQASPSTAHAESTRLRLTFLCLLVVSLFVLLFARLWFLQVMAAERYTQLAQGNAVRTIALEAPRGKILDRNGTPLVTNRYAMVVSVQPSEMGDRADAILADLADLLGLPLAEVQRRIETSRVGPFRPKPIAVDVDREIVFYIHENASTLYPGVYAEQLPLRQYPQEDSAAHVVGYLGEISEAELDDERYEGYRPGDRIGWAGVERTYESALRGTEGARTLEVDRRNQVVRELDEQLPTPGADLALTLDLEAQTLTEAALEQGILRAREVIDREEGPGRGGTFRAPAGAAVVLRPDGEILALASYPTFSPDAFVGGISEEAWAALQDKNNAFPLINRAVQSSYPPGSVFKVVTAGAALENGYLTQEQRLPCPGKWSWAGQTFRNWTRTDSPPMNLLEALQYSCDTVFYDLAKQMWTDEKGEQDAGVDVRERLTEHAARWGFGQRTGVVLPGERAGVNPGRDWKHEFWENNKHTYCAQAARSETDSYAFNLFNELCDEGFQWRGGDEVNMSIGQGEVQATPLQVANAFAAIANGGTLYEPRIVKEIVRRDGSTDTIEREVLGQLPVAPANLDYIKQGLQAVTSPSGTAGSVFGDFTIPVAGKTGTAEIRPRQPFAWFAAYAPADNPQYVVVALVEEGGGGSQIAAPIVRRIFEGLFDLEQSRFSVGEKTD
jgi:penicillin-binding protein 2